jgi:hypothetical protein
VGTLAGFGGEPITLFVPKTGLPFLDALRLYGAIDLYVGLREDVAVQDMGDCWEVEGFTRNHRIGERVVSAAEALKGEKPSNRDQKWLSALDAALRNNDTWPMAPTRTLKTPLDNPDSALKDGVRDQAASAYHGLESGRGEKAKIPWADAILAYAGQKRTENVADIMFLPVFEGRVDFSKVVSPLRAWLRTPNILCAQALILLALKASLFAEGYQERLTTVVYNTNFGSRKGFNYSGLIDIRSTAIDKMGSSGLVGHAYHTFRTLITKAWAQRRQPNDPTPEDALAMAYWLMQPVSKHLTSMITSQERLRARGSQQLFTKTEYVKGVFDMSYGDWQGDHGALRKLAKAVASSIYHTRMKGAENPRKNWYDEVVMLRSAPSAKAFIERVMILIEQGHREHGQVGTVHREEDFDPTAISAALGKDRSDFETFRDLFRMYLVQESTYKAEGETAPAAEAELEVNEEETTEGGTE